MSTHSIDLARAAVAALEEALKKEGLSASPRDLHDLLLKAVEERTGTLVATITTPSGQSGTLAEKVKTALEKKTGKTIEIRDVADKNLIGGAIVSYGDERIDMSAARVLEDAKFFLSQAKN